LITLLKPDWKFISASPARLIAFGFGSGLSPRAPGTAGTVAGVLLYLLLTVILSTNAITALLILFFALGVWACEKTGRDLGVADHGGMVWDEIVAIMLVLLFTPRTGLFFLIAFALFRLFDIWKPFPIRQLEAKCKGGFGVMIDDILAALFSIAIILILKRLFDLPSIYLL
jgi:phosphatidylglycerophosphatase A